MRTILGCAALFAAALSAAQASPSDASAMSLDECAILARELSFARSMESHDLHVFAEHLHPAAVFISGNTPLRGRDEIVKAWRGLVEGTGPVSLHWYPTQIAISADIPGFALSTGPVWILDKRPNSKNKYLRGNFMSTWKRDDNGTWHVLYDSGGDATPITEAQFEAGKAGPAYACPHA